MALKHRGLIFVFYARKFFQSAEARGVLPLHEIENNLLWYNQTCQVLQTYNLYNLQNLRSLLPGVFFE